jgi:thioester reductase-like protein
VLAQLTTKEDVKSVYCLVRASSQESAQNRVFSTLAAKKIDTPANLNKIVCFPSDLSREDLGLDKTTVDILRKSLTTVIHCAWAVNFNLGVQSFEKQHIKGTYNLLNMCLNVTTQSPAKLFFCSSISAAAGTPLPAVIQETFISDLNHAQNMGYARSKLVTETIIKAAAQQTGMVAEVLRVGQIVGDTQNGMWNSTEAISLMIRSATTIGALPALEEVSVYFYIILVLWLIEVDSILAACGRCRPCRSRSCPYQQDAVSIPSTRRRINSLPCAKFTHLPLDPRSFTSLTCCGARI